MKPQRWDLAPFISDLGPFFSVLAPFFSDLGPFFRFHSSPTSELRNPVRFHFGSKVHFSDLGLTQVHFFRPGSEHVQTWLHYFQTWVYFPRPTFLW